jgi:hypothetical protein
LHSINYDLYNEYSNVPFEIALNNLVEDEIKVANGTIMFNLDDEFGNPITNANVVLLEAGSDEIILESEDYERAAIVDGNYTIDHIPTNIYDIILEVPSGYKIADGYTYNLNADGDILFTNRNLNYNNPLLSYTLHFETLDVGGISIRTAADEDLLYANNTTDDTDVVMTFRPMSNMDEMKLPIIDTFTLAGDITIDPSSLVVKNAAGNAVGGFTFVGNTLTFDKNRAGAPSYLPMANYTAEFTITNLPANLSGQSAPGFEFDLTVVETYTKGVGVSTFRYNDTSARELTIHYDEIGPVITLVPSATVVSSDNVIVDIDINSEFTELVDYRLVRVDAGHASISDFNSVLVGGGFADLNDSNLYHVLGDFEITIHEEDIENPNIGLYKGNGYFAVLAIDKAGNVPIGIIDVDNLIDINYIEQLL